MILVPAPKGRINVGHGSSAAKPVDPENPSMSWKSTHHGNTEDTEKNLWPLGLFPARLRGMEESDRNHSPPQRTGEGKQRSKAKL